MRRFPGWSWIVFPGCWALTGPQEARGPVGGELNVQCWYGKGYENYIKYWCRGTSRPSCLTVVRTGSEAMKSDRVSIRDIHTFCMFLVTMRNVTEGDSGTYWCGIDRPVFDLMFSVQVNVLPAVPTSPAPEREPSVNAASTASFTWTASEAAEPTSMVNNSNPPEGTGNPVLHILTPCLLLVLLLVCLTGVVLRWTSMRRNKALQGALGQWEKDTHPYLPVPGNMQFYDTSDPAPCSEAAVCKTLEETPHTGAEETIYDNELQASGSTEEVVCDVLTRPASQLQAIYANMTPTACNRTAPSHRQTPHKKKAAG
ncbi:CMRF35-like molecule 5 [Carettochelys insculpta]|uniref:CMRF35-like molecule 5 n=1 Tax=Carettochelys insculpta TaxID=44489 RepID=UPI003EBF7165